MKEKPLLLALVLAGIITAAAFTSALPPSPVKTETVTFKSGDETASGYLATPGTKGRHPALVVIHEWWGLNDWVREQARDYADHGYVALAVDLYRGKSATTPDEAHELMRGLPQDRAVRDMDAAFHYLAARDDVKPDKIGSIGWCMGGGLSLQLAIHEPKLAACVVNYGAMPTDAADIAKIPSPVLGNFGALDRGISPDAVHAFEAAMKAAGKSIDAKIYEGAGHGFENSTNKDAYRPDATKDARERILAFLDKTLK